MSVSGVGTQTYPKLKVHKTSDSIHGNATVGEDLLNTLK